MSRLLLAAAAALAATTALALPVGGRAAAACGTRSYSYAGLAASSGGYGVAATITPLMRPTVRAGHVAAWVGVGGPGEGPHGSDEWLQVGISVEPGRGDALYYELAAPGQTPRYVMLKGHLPLDRGYRVAVLESPARHGAWAVWVNGTRMTRLIDLPGSHGVFGPVATTESWNGNVGACNTFRFGFAHVNVAARPGGSWTPMVAGVLDGPGYAVVRRTRGSFVALGGI